MDLSISPSTHWSCNSSTPLDSLLIGAQETQNKPCEMKKTHFEIKKYIEVSDFWRCKIDVFSLVLSCFESLELEKRVLSCESMNVHHSRKKMSLVSENDR
jgi:hypothetical protein